MVTTKNVGPRARVVEAAVSMTNVSYAELCSPANDRAWAYMTANAPAIATGRSDTKTEGHPPRPPIDFSAPTAGPMR
jgi:hypothetical protein